MSTTPLGQVIRQLRQEEPETDGQLLAQVIARRDEAAFAALVRRHGPMVWGVCRRVLRSHHDAEDAFQATFLVLARKAAAIASRERLANWLYGVAYRTALKARETASRRQAREKQVAPMPEPESSPPDLGNDWQPLLDQELSGLPEKYRVPIVLCYLEGRTRGQAARQLGVPEGTVAGRLARGRTLLAKRLARRGVVVSGATLAALIAAPADAPASVVAATIQAAATGVLSRPVAALTEGVLKAMFLSRVKIIALLLVLFLGVSGLTAGALAYRVSGAEAPLPIAAAPLPPDERQVKGDAPANAVQKDRDVKKDQPADELQQVIDHVLKAHGGENNLNGLKAFTEKKKFELSGYTEAESIVEYFVQQPDKYRVEGPTKGGVLTVSIFDGRSMKRWLKHSDGKVEEVAVQENETRPEYWIDVVKFFGPRAVLRLKDPANKLSLLPEIKIGDRAAVGIQVTGKIGPELKLFFDKETGLLLKEEQGDSGSISYSDYKKLNGIPIARKWTFGQQLLYAPVGNVTEIVEFKPVDKLDARLFEKP